MSLICYHASQEQFSPSQLLKYVVSAEQAGFTGIHSSDHFHPWSKRQGQSGFTFSWIAAAMQATKLPFSMVCTPGQRLHPAIVAQAISTLGEMFPGRFSIELGTGEALNEKITGEDWPSADIRKERLKEAARIIRKLLSGEEVSYHGHVKVHEAKLYTLPPITPLLLCAVLTEESAAWAGEWADGLLTTSGTKEDVSKKMSLFADKGGEGKPVYLQFAFSYARRRQAAIDGLCDQWRSNIIPGEKFARFYKVEHFDAEGEKNSVEDVMKAIPVYTDIQEIKSHIREMSGLGAERIILHNVNRLQEEFIMDASEIF